MSSKKELTSEELEEIINKALEKQRVELFSHLSSWTGLDMEDPNTGYKIRKAFEFASAGSESNERALKIVRFWGSIIGVIIAISFLANQLNIRNLFLK